MGKCYVPSGDKSLLDFCKNLFSYANANSSKWGVEGPAEHIADKLDDFESKYIKTLAKNRGQIDVEDKNRAKKVLVSAVRTYVQGFLAKNPNVNDSDRRKMGLTVYKEKGTKIPIPKRIPVVQATCPKPLQIRIDISALGSEPQDKRPEHGCKIIYGIMPPRTVAEKKSVSGITIIKDEIINRDSLVDGMFSKRKLITMPFDTQERGWTLFLCARFENGKGEAGPWGDIASVVIS